MTVPQIKQGQFPSTSLPIHQSLLTPPFDGIQFENTEIKTGKKNCVQQFQDK
jgi:hypothetical protein